VRGNIAMQTRAKLLESMTLIELVA